MKVKKYHVHYKGCAVVYADSFEEARQRYAYGEEVSDSKKITLIKEVYSHKSGDADEASAEATA